MNLSSISHGLAALQPRAQIGGGISFVVVLAALLAPVFSPHDPNQQNLIATLLPPSFMDGGDPAYLLGTDSLGRCLASQLLYGARIALLVGIGAAVGASIIGSALALIAGYFGGLVDRVIGYLIDIWMSVPPVVLSIALMVGLGTGVSNVILSIVLVDWTRFCRVVRSSVIVVRRSDYVPAARLLGFSHPRIILTEVLPGVAPLIVTLFTLQVGIGVIVEAILSFIGLSVPSDVPAWGMMIADARNYMHQAPWGVVMPICAIFVTVLGLNLFGEGLRLSFDPRLRSR